MLEPRSPLPEPGDTLAGHPPSLGLSFLVWSTSFPSQLGPGAPVGSERSLTLLKAGLGGGGCGGRKTKIIGREREEKRGRGEGNGGGEERALREKKLMMSIIFV